MVRAFSLRLDITGEPPPLRSGLAVGAWRGGSCQLNLETSSESWAFCFLGRADSVFGYIASRFLYQGGWALPYAGPTVGGCDVLSRTFTGVADPTTAVSLLDAGHISVSGPGLASGSKLTSFPSTRGPTYNLTPTQGTFALGGTYTLTGSGGTQVGPFNISATLPSSFTVTNWNNLTSINRASAGARPCCGSCRHPSQVRGSRRAAISR